MNACLQCSLDFSRVTTETYLLFSSCLSENADSIYACMFFFSRRSIYL